MKFLSILTKDKRLKISFMDYRTVVVQDLRYTDVETNKPIPVVVQFDEKQSAWVYADSKAYPQFFTVGEQIEQELAIWIMENQMKYMDQLQGLQEVEGELDELEEF